MRWQAEEVKRRRLWGGGQGGLRTFAVRAATASPAPMKAASSSMPSSTQTVLSTSKQTACGSGAAERIAVRARELQNLRSCSSGVATVPSSHPHVRAHRQSSRLLASPRLLPCKRGATRVSAVKTGLLDAAAARNHTHFSPAEAAAITCPFRATWPVEKETASGWVQRHEQAPDYPTCANLRLASVLPALFCYLGEALPTWRRKNERTGKASISTTTATVIGTHTTRRLRHDDKNSFLILLV